MMVYRLDMEKNDIGSGVPALLVLLSDMLISENYVGKPERLCNINRFVH